MRKIQSKALILFWNGALTKLVERSAVLKAILGMQD
jgi:hypothetical protein